MKSFKFQPVVWLTVIATVLGALLQVDSTFHVLPAGVAHWVAAVAEIGRASCRERV